jgi:hypothetical protein
MPCFPKERAYVRQDWVVRGIYRRDADIPYDANFFRAAFRHCGRQGYRNQALGWNTYR